MLAAVGCDQDQIATQFNPAGEDASTAWFAQSAISQEFLTTDTGEQTILVDVYRQSAEGELTAGLWYEMGDGAAEFLSFPETVYFANGEYKASLPITVANVENFSKGTTYTVTIGIGDHHEFEDIELSKSSLKRYNGGRAVDSDKYESITISTTLQLDWQPCYILKDPSKLLNDSATFTEEDYVKGADGKPMLQTAIYRDWGWEDNQAVELQRAAGTTVFRIFNAFEGACNIIFTVDTNPENMLTIDGTKYYRCVLTPQGIGIEYDAGVEFFIGDVPNTLGGTYNTYPCYWDGSRTFYFTLFWHLPALGAGQGFNSFGAGPSDFLFLDAGVPADPEPEVEISYEGVETSATGLQSYKLSFAPNADAAKYYATIFEMDIEALCGLDYNTVATKTMQFLAANGITTSNPNFGSYFNTYFPQFLELSQESVYEMLEAEREAVESGEYKDFPVLELTKASSEAWEVGAAGMYTAVAYSYDKKGEISGLDYFVFLHNPEGDASAVPCEMYFTNASYDDPYASAECAFDDNALYAEWSGGKNINSVKYALLTAEEFAAAGFTDASTDEDFIKYLNENGKSLSADDLNAVNDVNVEGAYASLYLPAKPATEYYLISSMSDTDATKVDVQTAKTADTIDGSFAMNASAVTADLTDDGKADVYSHTNVVIQIQGSHVCAADYLVSAASSFKNYLVKNEDGSFSLAEGKTDADIIALIEENGKSLSSGYSASGTDLMLINALGYPATLSSSAKPNTEYFVLACYDLTGEGCKNWVAQSVTTEFAPAVAFTQTAVAEGNNLLFNWSAQPTASIFEVSEVNYALVKTSELEGVDLTKIGDNDLNNFEAQLAAGGDEAALAAAKENADKIMAVLAANMKTFEGDAAYAVNNPGGVNKQFTNLEAGEYALISFVADSYNTKLSVSLVTIQ